MTDLREIADRLRALGARRPTPEARAELVAALSNKWEGIQAVAVRALASWGDRASIEQLRQFLTRCFDRKYGWGIRGVVVDVLRPVVTEEDVDWVLDLYFNLHGSLRKHELLWLVTALPPVAARERLMAALRDPRGDNRRAAVKAIGNMNYPNRRQLLWQLRDDPDEDVRRSVQVLASDG